jgi:DNA-directed RNA polymerase subunit RPC12/RpoP
MEMMRIDPKSSNLICRNCIERKPVQKQEAIAENKQKKEEMSSFKEYFCKSCKYSFKRAKHLAVSTCPYCSSKSLMVKGSMARIMADVAKMK